MLQLDDVERLSKLLAGEASPDEERELRDRMTREPELHVAWDRLRALEAVTSELSAERPPAVERLISKTVGRSSRRWLVLAAALVLVALGAALVARTRSEPPAPFENVTANPSVASTKIADDAELVDEGENVRRLVRGTAIVECERCVVLVNDERLIIRGRALISTEPSVANRHVTSSAAPTPEENDMIRRVMTQWTAASFAVLVLSGEVQADEVLTKGSTLARPAAKAAPLPFDFAELRAAIEPQRPALTECAKAALPSDGELKLVLNLAISATGYLDRLSIRERPALESCFTTALSRVKWPAPRGGKAAMLAYPITIARNARHTMLALPETADCQDCVPVLDRVERVKVDVGASPARGPSDARVTVVLFSEAECSFCVKAHGVLKQLEQDYAGKVRFVFKHYPLPEHRGALEAARALHAAHSQGRFWDLLDSAYGTPVSTESGLYDAQARALGLDLQQYRRDVVSKETAAVIDADIAEAKRLGVKGVPAWFINGKEVVGFRPVEVMRQEIDAELANPPN